MAKATQLLNSANAGCDEAKAERETAAGAGDTDGVIKAEAKISANEAIIEAQRKRLADLGRQHTDELNREDEAEFDRYCADLEKRMASQAKTFERDQAKAFAPAAAFVAAQVGNADECAAANPRRLARSLPPILTAEERVRVIPGYTKSARYEEKVIWRKWEGGPEVSIFQKNAAGEWVPEEGGCVRSVEQRLVSREEDVSARRAESLATAVVLPGLLPGDAMAWPPKGVTR